MVSILPTIMVMIIPVVTTPTMVPITTVAIPSVTVTVPIVVPAVAIPTAVISATTVIAAAAIVTAAIILTIKTAKRIDQAPENVQRAAADDLTVALDGPVIIEDISVATGLHERVGIEEPIHRAALRLYDGRIFVRNNAGLTEAFVRHGVIVATNVSNLRVRGRCTE